MSASRATKFIVIGGVLVVGSWVALMLSVLEMIPTTLSSLFVSYLASIGGLAIGLVGMVSYVSARRER